MAVPLGTAVKYKLSSRWQMLQLPQSTYPLFNVSVLIVRVHFALLQSKTPAMHQSNSGRYQIPHGCLPAVLPCRDEGWLAICVPTVGIET